MRLKQNGERFLAKGLGVLVFGAFMLTGCLTSKRVDKWVAKQYEGRMVTNDKKKPDFIVVNSSLTQRDNQFSTTESKTTRFLPLIFYWQYDYENTCTLNPNIGIQEFTKTANSYGVKVLKQKLTGKRMELSVMQIPHVFTIDDRGHIIWVLLYAFGWDSFTVEPKKSSLQVNYKILNADNTEYKSGSITVEDKNQTLRLKMFQSLKKKTWQYLEQYDAAINTMSKAFVDQLNKEL